jgi:hypothetical protein
VPIPAIRYKFRFEIFFFGSAGASAVALPLKKKNFKTHILGQKKDED